MRDSKPRSDSSSDDLESDEMTKRGVAASELRHIHSLIEQERRDAVAARRFAQISTALIIGTFCGLWLLTAVWYRMETINSRPLSIRDAVMISVYSLLTCVPLTMAYCIKKRAPVRHAVRSGIVATLVVSGATCALLALV